MPWRNTKDAYLIWLSEVILQQTRVAQGLPYYQKFAENYPTVVDLANAPVDEVMRLWQGLGYYSRARNMHNTAKLIVENHNGVFPDNYTTLIKLKGIGPYTAAAVASFAFEEQVPVVDGNVYRVLARFFDIETDTLSPAGQKVFRQKAEQIINNTENASLHNQAIMEFGALQCTPKGYLCTFCTMADLCEANLQSKQANLPVKIKKLKIKERQFFYFLVETKGQFLMQKRIGKGIWEGLYEPYLVETEGNSDEAIAQFSQKVNSKKFILISISEPKKHILTHQKLHISFVHVQMNDIAIASKQDYYEPEQVLQLPKPIVVADFFDQFLDGL